MAIQRPLLGECCCAPLEFGEREKKNPENRTNCIGKGPKDAQSERNIFYKHKVKLFPLALLKRIAIIAFTAREHIFGRKIHMGFAKEILSASWNTGFGDEAWALRPRGNHGERGINALRSDQNRVYNACNVFGSAGRVSSTFRQKLYSSGTFSMCIVWYGSKNGSVAVKALLWRLVSGSSWLHIEGHLHV